MPPDGPEAEEYDILVCWVSFSGIPRHVPHWPILKSGPTPGLTSLQSTVLSQFEKGH